MVLLVNKQAQAAKAAFLSGFVIRTLLMAGLLAFSPLKSTSRETQASALGGVNRGDLFRPYLYYFAATWAEFSLCVSLRFNRKNLAMFGKRKDNMSGGPSGPTAPPREDTETNFPWSNSAESTACNFAAGHLARNWQVPLIESNGALHAETFICAIGAVAGQAAAIAAYSSDNNPPDKLQLQLLKDPNGKEFILSAQVLARLIHQTDTDGRVDEKIWNILAGWAVNGGGLSVAQLPDLNSLLARTREMLLSGRPLVPLTADGKRPGADVETLLRLMWPLVESCFTGSISKIIPEHLKMSPQKWWGAIAAQAANSQFGALGKILGAKSVVELAMISAMIGSTIPPARIRGSLHTHY